MPEIVIEIQSKDLTKWNRLTGISYDSEAPTSYTSKGKNPKKVLCRKDAEEQARKCRDGWRVSGQFNVNRRIRAVVIKGSIWNPEYIELQ